MTQANYGTIISCIQHGAPAIANELIADFNKTVELANDRITYLKQQEEAERQRQQVEAAVAKEKKKIPIKEVKE